MTTRPKYTKDQIIEALQATKGMVYLAAERLGCSHVTVYNYINRYSAVKDAFQSESGKLLDVGELKLYQAVQNGEGWAIAFLLKTKGKERGYTERSQIELLQKELEGTLIKLEKSLEPELYERVLGIIAEDG